MYKGMKDGMRNNNVKPVPPRDPNQGTTRNEQQFSTNAVNNPNGVEPKTSTSTNGTNTVPTKPNASIPSRPSGSLASTIPINTSNVSSSDGDGTTNGVSEGTASSNQHKPVVNAGGQGHIYPQRKHTLLGGNRTVQRASHYLSRAHNTGYDIGQKMSQFEGKVQQAKQIKIEKRGLKSNEIRDTERD